MAILEEKNEKSLKYRKIILLINFIFILTFFLIASYQSLKNYAILINYKSLFQEKDSLQNFVLENVFLMVSAIKEFIFKNQKQ